MRATHAARLERWLGAERISQLQAAMRGWYGGPIHLIDVPGSVRITADGDFIGPFERGYYMSALDAFAEFWKRLGKVEHGVAAGGFSSISNALAQASGGASQRRYVNKGGPTGVVAVTSSLWRLGTQPSGGSAGAAAPGGTAHTNTNAGSLNFSDPASGKNRLVGADFFASILNNTLLLYDRLFSVAKTMASTATEAVTGVPTRYQSTTATAEDYAGDSFGFIEVGGTALAATAHNWTVCKYTNQAGTTGQTLPSVTGNSAAIVDRLDQPASTWFTPLAAGDTGIAAWSQMQCSASVATGAINFCIGHPLGFMTFPVVNSLFPFDWLTNRDQAPAVFNGACPAFLEILKPSTTATTYNGRVYVTAGA